MTVRERANQAAALFEGIAAAFLAVVMMATVLDVALRAVDPAWRILGIVEIVQLNFGWMIFIAVPAVFLGGRNIVVNVLDERISEAALRVLVRGGGVATIIYVGLVFTQTVITGFDGIAYGDQTQDLAIPIVWFWLPIWIGFGGALLAELLSVVWPVLPSHRGRDST